MKKEDIKKSLDKIEPDELAKERMLNRILQFDDNRKEEKLMRERNFRKAIPVVAISLVVVGGSLIYHSIQKNNRDYMSSIENASGSMQEDNIARIENQFQIDDKYYTILSEEEKKEFGFTEEITDKEIGEQIIIITNTVDEKLIGIEVYEFLPAGGQAVVAINMDNEYKLFKFFNYKSYMENEDEDAMEYLELYGIHGPLDLDRVDLIQISELDKLDGNTGVTSSINGAGDVEKFYNFYSVLKNSSKEYFDQLSNYSNMDMGDDDGSGDEGTTSDDGGNIVEPVAPDALDSSDEQDSKVIVNSTSISATDLGMDSTTSNVESKPKTGASRAVSQEGSQGRAGNALSDSIIIRIYNKQGVYMETTYYPNINFISRYKVNEEFANFLMDSLNN